MADRRDGDSDDARSLTLTRVIHATPATIWRCWSDPDLLPQWFGPEGHSCRTTDIQLGPGGHWIFDMFGPKGEVWANRHRYTDWQPPLRLGFWMDDGTDAAPPAAVSVVLTPDGASRTRVTHRMTFATPEICRMVEGFGAVELSLTTYAKLARLAESLADPAAGQDGGQGGGDKDA